MALSNPSAVQRPRQPIARKWWKESTVYQIYPASFLDSTGSGTGDIPGITSKLDYIHQLGADIVWLSPILQSPQVDMGYDISDYRAIDPQYGTMADHDALIAGLHERGMKYVMDLVVNHTSDQHEWFRQSRSSKENPYRDWYIWRPARVHPETGARMPPNNWLSYFSGSAWAWDEATQEYYLHLFATEQPDLNWENPKVVEAVHEMIRFWLDKGVDGFRMDVINFISKEPGLPDAPVTQPGFLQSGVSHHSCGPRLHEFLQGIGRILQDYDAFSVGEMPGVTDAAEIVKGVGQDRNELGMVFIFEAVDMDHAPSSKFLRRPFRVSELRQITNKWQTFMLDNAGWNALYLENHDQGRSVSRYADDSSQNRTLSAKMLATFLAGSSGTVYIYQGQELAMTNVPQDWMSDPERWYRDIELLNHWRETRAAHPSDSAEDTARRDEALYQYRLLGRDNARTPMQWDTSSPNAGFSSAKPFPLGSWMSVHPDHDVWNAENALDNKSSAFWYWRDLLDLRKREKEVFVYGGFDMLGLDLDDEQDGDGSKVIAYVRTSDDSKRQALVVTSFDRTNVRWEVPVVARRCLEKGKVVLASYGDEPRIDVGQGVVELRPFEALVLLA